MENYRNFIEYGIFLNMKKILICQQDDLYSDKIDIEFNDNFPCNIYFIIARPRITIVPEKCEFNDLVKLVFKIQIKNEFIYRYISFDPKGLDYSNAKIESNYPYSLFKLIVNNEVIFTAKSSIYYTLNSNNNTEEFDAEILYIGQSYGKKGDRKVSERLKTHSTLQKIYSDINQNNPDKEIWLNLLSFEREMNMIFDGFSGLAKRKENDIINSANIIQKFSNRELKESELINLAEAALIKYFKPKYNYVYKNVFPSIDHKSYKEALELDVNCIGIQLDTETINLKLYSDEVKPNFHNIFTYTLKSKENRMNLFEIFNNNIS